MKTFALFVTQNMYLSSLLQVLLIGQLMSGTTKLTEIDNFKILSDKLLQ